MNDNAVTAKESGPETPVADSLIEEPSGGAATESVTAGALLKRLREQAGWSLDKLAGALKVPVKTLVALEGNDMTQLPDLVFSRALAASICRTLKVDAAPVLALMPQLVRSSDLVKPEVSLNVSMGRSVNFSGPLGWLKTRSALFVGLILVGILVLGNWPTLTAWWSNYSAKGAEADQAAVVAQVTSQAAPVQPAQAQPLSTVALDANGVKTVVSEVVPLGQSAAAAASSAGVAAGGSGNTAPLNITVQTSAPSWIEVTDGSGKTLWKRLLERGDPVQLTAPSGSRMAVGNAAATRVTVNGKIIDLAPVTNANVARMDLQ